MPVESAAPPHSRVAAPDAIDVLPGEARVLAAAERSLRGERRGLRALSPFLGPAFIAAVAYVDPGNFATNFAGGAKYGYLLLWVIVLSNLMAMLVQTLSAKLGIATGLNLAEVCRERFPRSVSIGLWVQAEAIAMATDLAEFIGAALGLHLLFGIPLFPAGVITGVFAFAILALQARGFRQLEAVVAGLVGVILAGFAFQVVLADPSPAGVVSGLKPGFGDDESVLIAVGILGATVMPHVIWLHSALTQRRIVGASVEARRQIYRFERVDVVIAMSIAGLINMSMLITAASVFHARGMTGVDDLDEVFRGLGDVFTAHADVAFGLALLASGLSSSSVGTLAGQIVMQGFIRRQIPLFLRRAVTMAPALVVIGLGVNASAALVLSQVVLSFGIPFALIPLVLFSRDRDVMGALVSRRVTTVAASVVATMIIALNVVLLYLTFAA
ncbi:MAG: Nramp family divalent metal transporter [Actinomycetota bacterium]|nr:Nramp family divalent metal transporter [Actinomycetota bacterium]